MKIIVITGPSGSGKSYLSNKLAKSFKGSIIIKTDSFYKDELYIKILSIFFKDIYDRIISIKIKELNKTVEAINKKVKEVVFYDYDFRNKKSKKTSIEILYKQNTGFLILEGIFSHRLDLNYSKTLNIICNETKLKCYQRRIKRDKLERGRCRNEVDSKFNHSWYLFYLNLNNYIKNNNVIYINQEDDLSYEKLIHKINFFA
tara:strand:- start:205 stop:810 length:606 start_codon:yes stop_codon:yes gene_type:complete